MSDGRTLLRARMSVRRNELAARMRVAAAAGVLHSLEALPVLLDGPNVAGYWAVRGELPLNLVVAALARRGRRYFLPVLGRARHLRFAEYREGAPLRNNRFGIPEPDVAPDDLRAPQDMHAVLLPLLAFDRRGQRLGTGGGWYDTSLAFLRSMPRPGRPLLAGVGYAFQELEAIAPEPWDVRLDYVATEQELIACPADEFAH